MYNNDLQKLRDDNRKYLIYSRKSKFTGKGESVENQIEICKKYIRDHFDVNVKEEDIIIKQDEGFSGKDVKRPQYKEMMKLVEDKQIKLIICYKLDRISRNTLFLLLLFLCSFTFVFWVILNPIKLIFDL